MESDSIYHYGVLGMRWGVRKQPDGSTAKTGSAKDKSSGYEPDNPGRRRKNDPNPDYSDNQRKRDTQVYGKRGARRVNRAMNRGESVSVARGTEAKKRNRVMGRNKYVRQAGKWAGAGTAGAGALVAANKIGQFSSTSRGQAVLSSVLGPEGAQQASTLLNNPATKMAMTVGAGKVGHMMAGDIAVSANMRAGGYDPSKA